MPHGSPPLRRRAAMCAIQAFLFHRGGFQNSPQSLLLPPLPRGITGTTTSLVSLRFQSSAPDKRLSHSTSFLKLKRLSSKPVVARASVESPNSSEGEGTGGFAARNEVDSSKGVVEQAQPGLSTNGVIEENQTQLLIDGHGAENTTSEVRVEDRTHKLESGNDGLRQTVEEKKLVSEQESSGDREEKTGDGEKLSLPLYLARFLALAWKKMTAFSFSDWLSWWPLWQREKRLEQLLVQANANPRDASKQSALLAELNKHSPEAVIKRFEQRDHATDSWAVAEYLRALVVTNAISGYLPDERSGKPSGLPALLLELKQRASGSMDEPFSNPGMSEKHPLHVVMVDPKEANKSMRFAQELISTILFMIVFSLMWVMGAAALRKYVSSLGGIGSSPGISTGASYAPKEYNKEVLPEKNSKTFKDVKGCDEAKQELEEVVEYLKNPSKFTRLGGKLPKGILLTGAPGTGKTLLAKAIAGEAGVPFFYRAGSEFEEMFVGVGARRVRSLFQAAKKKAPCIIFIDEIDAVGSTRKQWEGHTKKTLHQLLVEMDGFEQNEGIILVAATNLPDVLDPALTRPGRFDRHIVVPSPDVRGRQEILDLYLQNKPLAEDVNVKALARGTPGFNGADLANLVNIAAIKAAVDGSEKLSAKQLEFAKDRIMMGTERKSMFLSEESKKLTAYHESGHAVVAFNTAGANPIHKATITPRGSALGMVTQLPDKDETSVNKTQLLARLDVCMGGRVAEELIFGQEYITTGASSDLHTATELAQYMVSTCGMSDAIGPVYIKERPSAEMQSRIDAEVVRILREAYERVKTLLKKHEAALHALAKALLENETLNAQEIEGILNPFQGRGDQQVEDVGQVEQADQVELAIS